MNIESKIWTWSDTGTKKHAFINGVALCRKNIRRNPESVHLRVLDYCEAKKGSSPCTSCDRKFNAAIERAEASMQPSTGEGDYLPPAAHLNPAPACTCPRMEPPAKYGHHIVCPLRATDSKENDNVTIKEGPLTERQVRIIEGLLAGKRHEEISRNLSTPDETVTVNVVKQECMNITAKFKAKTITQAVFIYSEAKAYRKAAQEILKTRIPVPFDTADEHANHVLEGLAELYQGRHDAWMPA